MNNDSIMSLWWNTLYLLIFFSQSSYQEEDESAKFFDGEEMLSVVDYECIDGTSSSNADSDKVCKI